MNAPFPSRFAFATTSPSASRAVSTDPAAARGLAVRAALRGLGVVVLAAVAALAAG